MTPLISIVVPTLNQAAYLEQTLASITGQNRSRLELIVIDGGSSDGTREIVERYPVQHFVSEKDSGQAAAINKGFRLAKGDVLAWLNSDDYYLPLTLARAVAALGVVSERRCIYGNCILYRQSDQRVTLSRSRPFDREALRTCCYPIQPSAFWTRALWDAAGELNEEYHFVLDWDWWLRASAAGEFRYLDECLSVYRLHAQHKTGSGSPRRRQEIVAFVERHGSAEWIAAFRAVDRRLQAMDGSHLDKLRHPGLFLRHGRHKTQSAFWQLHS